SLALLSLPVRHRPHGLARASEHGVGSSSGGCRSKTQTDDNGNHDDVVALHALTDVPSGAITPRGRDSARRQGTARNRQGLLPAPWRISSIRTPTTDAVAMARWPQRRPEGGEDSAPYLPYTAKVSFSSQQVGRIFS